MKVRLPNDGDIRVKTRFAFLPVVIGAHKVWFEFYLAVEQYHRLFTHEGHWQLMRYEEFRREA